ncbi:alanine racemase [Maribacter sedimenticola]|uniref:Alanine racemase n=1 Tax=Maribacter sedimenticola TaxID=228956 RepID=A0ABY1SIS1_9FLAO|nr:alanine racemase [Maribacter sedimenticola]SNR59115.1 alanine racemase [Maribacter sedimenticola]
MAKATETVLEIDLNALVHNYRYLRSRIRPETKFMAVVKAYGYGSDAQEIAMCLQQAQVDYFAVAYVNEGIALRKAGITIPILVLHPQKVHFKTLIEHNLEPSIYSHAILEQFIRTAQELGKLAYPIHLKFNTGLNRLGFTYADLPKIYTATEAQHAIKVKAILSHLAATEDRNETEYTQLQLNRFEAICNKAETLFGYKLIKHVLNTSGIINYPNAQLDMVRSGIGLYGYGNDATIDADLIPVVTLKTIIAQKHTIPAGESVGYNRKYVSKKPTVTATLPLGHADGIGRQYGQGNTFVLINGQLAPIVGNVCMDMIMVDVTEIECEEGDEVIIFGKKLPATEFSGTADTISYELLTGISQRIPRVIYKN